MWEITKHFDFCYGHRVHTQKLDAELSCNVGCKCRHLHGHQGKLKITLSSGKLTNGMVTDFHHLNWLKVWIDKYLDHKMILDVKDPYLIQLLKGEGLEDLTFFRPLHPTNYNADLRILVFAELLYERSNRILSDSSFEILEGLVLIDFVPTSENLAKFIFEWVSTVMEDHCSELDIKVEKVVFEETPKSSSTYRG